MVWGEYTMKIVTVSFRRGFFMLALFLFTSCTRTKIVTLTPPFEGVVRRPLQIQTECVLYKAAPRQYRYEQNVLITKLREGLWSSRPGSVIICRLLPGQTIILRDAFQYSSLGGVYYYMVGRTVCGEEYNFEYLYGVMGGEGEISLSRAPWEGDDTPARRVISAETGETLRIEDFESESIGNKRALETAR